MFSLNFTALPHCTGDEGKRRVRLDSGDSILCSTRAGISSKAFAEGSALRKVREVHFKCSPPITTLLFFPFSCRSCAAHLNATEGTASLNSLATGTSTPAPARGPGPASFFVIFCSRRPIVSPRRWTPSRSHRAISILRDANAGQVSCCNCFSPNEQR